MSVPRCVRRCVRLINMLWQGLKQLNIIVVYHILLDEKIYSTGDAYLFLYQIQFTPMRWFGTVLLPYFFFEPPRLIPLNIIVLGYSESSQDPRALIRFNPTHL